MLNFSALKLGDLPNRVQITLDDGNLLTIQSLARVLPNARVVVRGNLNQQPVYAKIYIGHRASIHADREAGGVKKLLAAHILTPKLLQETSYQNQPVIVYAAINNAVNAEDFMRQGDYLSRREMAIKLAQTVAKHHAANLMQTDIHLKNFLVAHENIYTIDGDGIVKTSSQQKKQHNLVTFFSKFDVLDDEFMQTSLQAYCAALGISFSNQYCTKMHFLTQKIRQKTASHYADKKVFRQCTDVNIYALEGMFSAVSGEASNINLPSNLQALDNLFNAQNLLKNGNTCTVALTEISGKKIVIKRYNIKNFWHGVSRALRQTRAAASWANAHRLKLLDIATAKPFALIEHREFGLIGKAYFLAEYIDAPDAAQFFAECTDKSARADAVKNICTLFYKLYLLKISHGDMKATNIKIVDNQPVLIDLDSMQQHRFDSFALRAHARDLRRFMQNWQNEPALYNAFVKTFKVVYSDSSILIKAGIGQNKEIDNQ